MKSVAAAALAAGLACGSGAAAEASAVPPAEGSPRWSLSLGYGFSVQLSRGRAEEQVLLFLPAAAIPLGRRFEWTIEGHFARYFAPPGYFFGWMPIGARFFFGLGELKPYASLGAGFGWTDLTELDEIDRRFNYLLQGSFGVLRDVPGKGAWSAEARISHISNAGTVLPNLGLNSIVFLAGWRFR